MCLHINTIINMLHTLMQLSSSVNITGLRTSTIIIIIFTQIQLIILHVTRNTMQLGCEAAELGRCLHKNTDVFACCSVFTVLAAVSFKPDAMHV